VVPLAISTRLGDDDAPRHSVAHSLPHQSSLTCQPPLFSRKPKLNVRTLPEPIVVVSSCSLQSPCDDESRNVSTRGRLVSSNLDSAHLPNGPWVSSLIFNRWRLQLAIHKGYSNRTIVHIDGIRAAVLATRVEQQPVNPSR
jgi:hypothetical protein